MKLSYLSQILILSFVLFLFLSCSTEPTAPENNNPPSVISGKVNQITQTGTVPADSCNISIITTTDTSTTITDNLGFFSDTLTSNDDSTRLIIEKDGFNTIDTTIQSSVAQNLNFIIYFNRIEVSGRLFEINANGTFILPYCKMKIYSGGVDNIIQSNNDGYFKLITNSFNNSVRIAIDKNLYSKLDTIVSIENAFDLEINLLKLAYFFPLEVGQFWSYSGFYGWVSDLYSSSLTGNENWELIELAQDSSWMKIKSDFSGYNINFYWGDPTDTTFFINEISIITIRIEEGRLYFDERSGSSISLLYRFFYALDNYYEPGIILFIDKLLIIHPDSVGDEVITKLNYYRSPDQKKLEFRLTRDIGFTELFCLFQEGVAGVQTSLTLK